MYATVCDDFGIFNSVYFAVSFEVCDHVIASCAEVSRQLGFTKILVNKKDMTATTRRTL